MKRRPPLLINQTSDPIDLRYNTGLFNDEAHPVCQGIEGMHRYYCGLKRSRIHIPGTDGRCGPTNGNNCPSCKRFTLDKGIDSGDDWDSEGDGDGDYYFNDSNEPRISWTEGPDPSVNITHHGRPIVKYNAFFPNPLSKYPHLYEDCRAFPDLRGEHWDTGLSGHFVIESVYTKLLGDVNPRVFSDACKIMTNDIRGIQADECLAECKGMVRPYFSNDGEDGFKGILPGGAPDCVKLLTMDFKQSKCMHLAVKAEGAVILVTIEFDRWMTDGANMCSPDRMDELFKLLKECGVFSAPLSPAPGSEESVMR
ncbi:hypothetical protein T484DRAFT_1758277 [Baffinella frigidus]|nr:hypothetical protein T484DRAFT_1758277 [Cryptophyta sp. CCMP2293]